MLECNGFLIAVTRSPGAWSTCHCDVVPSWYFGAFRARTWPIRVDTVASWKLTSRRVTVLTWVYFLVRNWCWEILQPRDQYRRTSSHPASWRVRFHPALKVLSTFALPSATLMGFQVESSVRRRPGPESSPDSGYVFQPSVPPSSHPSNRARFIRHRQRLQ